MRFKRILSQEVRLTVFDLNELSEPLKYLCEKAKNMAFQAYSVYSNFRVGAAVLLEDGQIIGGNNQENVAFPSGLCAERTALFYAHAQFPDKKIKAIAIYSPDAKNLLTPCGACRQVMLEYESIQGDSIQTFIVTNEEVYVMDSVKDWLPFEFSADLRR
ncbi:MAG: hypothetical protein KatS3mg027_0534 [Bacteroidia bacterium]|nr:MAG: hypothetical protein KatS3mg027_0534 [Bacteroidia bacterium]